MELQEDDIIVVDENLQFISVNGEYHIQLDNLVGDSFVIRGIKRVSKPTNIEKACRVYKVSNLHTHLDEQHNKTFQRFTCGPYQLVTGNHYVEDQLGVVIPAGAIVPDNISKEMWVYNRLGGKKKNRVLQKTMYNYQTDGLFYGRTWVDLDSTVKKGLLWNDSWKEGDDVTQELGVTFNG
jgi:hypothetical protein